MAASRVLSELLSLLRLESIGKNKFRGQSQDLGFRSVFGGQVLGQSLSAASRTLEEGSLKNPHSLHGYFIRPGDAKVSIEYEVENVRDGASFATRSVTASQNGKVIFTMMASFHISEPSESHQISIPGDLPQPETLESELSIIRKHQEFIHPSVRSKFTSDKPFEIRPIDVSYPWNVVPGPAKQGFWLKTNGEVPDSPAIHRYLLAYATDYHLILPSMRPHGLYLSQPDLQIASIDHALWYHRDFKIDKDWLLFWMESPSFEHSRGFNRGSIFTRDGKLIASVAQEGLIRRIKAQKNNVVI